MTTLTQEPSRIGRFWSRVDRPDNPEGSTGLDAPHWIGDWPIASDGRRLQHTWLGKKNVNPARAAWELTHGVTLDYHRIYRQCDEVRCVNPEHHTAAKYDPLKDPVVLQRLVEGLPERKMCGRCGHPLAPAGGCSNCRKQKRHRREEYIRRYGRVPPLPASYNERWYPRDEEIRTPGRPATNGHLHVVPPLEIDELPELEPQPSLDEIMDDIFGASR